MNTAPWLKASMFAGLTALSSSQVIIAHRGPPAHAVRRHVIETRVYDEAEDRAHWSAKLGRAITEVEHLEIRSNLVAFVRALIAPAGRPQ